MNEELFQNSGLFSEERLADLQTLPEWDCDEAAKAAQTTIVDALEKHSNLLHNDATEPQTKFFMVNPTLHALGYVYSIGEDVPVQDNTHIRVDYTLFESYDTFGEAETMRGTTSFFRNAIGLVQVAGWGVSLDLADEAEVAATQPVVMMDVFLRTTGVEFGLITNGHKMRVLSRTTSEDLNTFFEADITKLARAPLEDFKLFYLLARRDAFQLNDEGTCFATRFLAD